jgi:hypothetical protein
MRDIGEKLMSCSKPTQPLEKVDPNLHEVMCRGGLRGLPFGTRVEQNR